MWNLIFDVTPWWVYLTICGIGICIALYFAGPVLIPLWRATPQKVKFAVYVVASLGLAYFAGRNKGHKNAKQEQEKANEHALETRRDVDRSVERASPADIDRRLDKFMRD